MSSRKFDCSVIGDVILDVFLAVAGESIPILSGGTSYCNTAKIDFGGAGNIASAISHLGGRTSFIGKAGSDIWGLLYEKDLTSRGVTSRVFFEERSSTGLALTILREKGERSFCVFRGANDKLSTKEIDDSIWLFENSRYFYFSGYSLVANPQRRAVLHAVKLAKEHGARIVFDPGSHNLVNSNFQLFGKLLDLCDVFCPNIQEAMEITRTSELRSAVLGLKRKGMLTAIKCGANGCILIRKEETVKIPASRASCVDTTGAGDAFVAALLHGLIHMSSLRSIGLFANWFAAHVVTEIGARNFVGKSEISKFLRSPL